MRPGARCVCLGTDRSSSSSNGGGGGSGCSRRRRAAAAAREQAAAAQRRQETQLRHKQQLPRWRLPSGQRQHMQYRRQRWRWQRSGTGRQQQRHIGVPAAAAAAHPARRFPPLRCACCPSRQQTRLARSAWQSRQDTQARGWYKVQRANLAAALHPPSRDFLLHSEAPPLGLPPRDVLHTRQPAVAPQGKLRVPRVPLRSRSSPWCPSGGRPSAGAPPRACRCRCTRGSAGREQGEPRRVRLHRPAPARRPPRQLNNATASGPQQCNSRRRCNRGAPSPSSAGLRPPGGPAPRPPGRGLPPM